jgi:hypothetical protein
LKGELHIKLKFQEAIVVASNIDLLQFDDCQKSFLKAAGILEGLEISGIPSVINFAFKQDVSLFGALDNSNRIFKTPDKFIDGPFANNDFHILIRHNGRVLVQGIDFFIAESAGTGTGFDTVILNFTPKPRSILAADYVVQIAV